MKKYIYCSEEPEIGKEDSSFDAFMDKVKASRGFKQVAALCTKNGYKLFTLWWEGRRLECNMRPVDEYAEEVYIRHDRRDPRGFYFVAQTGAHGALTADEFNKFRNAVDKTDALLTALNDLDFESMDIMQAEEED